MSKNDIALSCTACSALAHSLLQHCSEGSLEQVGQSKRCNTFKKGQIMFFEGNNPLGIYCVRSGTIKLYKIGLGGKEQIVRLAKPGDLLGYRAVLAEETYALSAAVLEDATACFIPRDEFVAALEQHPELYRQTLKSLCSELGVMQERLQSMAQRSVRERLAGILLLLRENFEEQAVESGLEPEVIGVKLPREDLANLTGTSTETVIRLLSEFQSDGFVKLEGKRIRLQNPDRLTRLAKMGY
mgnify:CR=1 FL=1